MKPIIGVTQTITNDERYYQVSKNNLVAIERAGGIPVVLSYLGNRQMIRQIADMIDGLYLTGGDDIDPVHFNEEPHPRLGSYFPQRDAFEMELTKVMLGKNKPILGVCKGAQILNLAAGGDMYQDIYAQIDQSLLQHSQHSPNYTASHEVNVKKESLLYRIIGNEKIRVNSFHHQANRKVGKGFIVSGKSSDGVIEAVESVLHRFALGVQWHPEMLAVAGDDALSWKIYESFIEASQKKRIRH
ncbi:gamma-glutamyl-gamma-aminobutyrate hydrolase family protein [Oceanobacillus sp. CAU 1775]